jgi:DNA-binding SARP family transcriptional activator/tetratricopeptide (TPR) repeat protein
VTVRIRLLGGFEVAVDGVPVPPEAWARRHAAALVKLLALHPGRRLHREQVIDALWPGLPVDVAGPRLHKAAHYARRALGHDGGALLLRHEMVALATDDVQVDVDEFQRLGAEAVAAAAPDLAAQALVLHAGPLLPDDLYEPWADQARDAVRSLHLDLLRLAGRWEELLAEDPVDEQAHLALVRASADRGDVRGALRQLERLDQALRRELGTTPGPEAQQLRARLEAGLPESRTPERPTGTRLFGRRAVGDELRARMEAAEAGRGSTLLLTGPPGVGKTAVLDLAEALARQRGWRTGRGTASAVEGPWPYAPALEALSDLCRRHPALLDGLDEAFRAELERGLSGRDVSWSGESGHQRLFVAAAELLRLAAAGHGLLLVVDDVHEADEASLRLLHYLARCALGESVVIALAHRPLTQQPLHQVADSLVARGVGARVELAPLTEAATRRLLADRFPDLAEEETDRVWAVSGGLPFTALELARAVQTGARLSATALPVLPDGVLRTFRRVALLGSAFTTDELLAVSGVGEDEAYRHLEVALAALVVEPAEAGFRFRHPMVRDALVDGMPAYAVAAARREVAEQLAGLGAPPGRVAHHLLAAGLPSRATPYVLRAVESAGALGAYREGLTLVDEVRDHAGPDELPRLLARRGDLLLALGDPAAIEAYREAVAVTTGIDNRLVRARLARAAGFVGDLDTARAALAGLTLEGDAADGSILLAQGNLAYFSGDVDAAWDVAGRARELLQSPEDPWHLVDLVSLQGLIAHRRGEWFDRFRMELRRTQGKDRLVTALFDAHLCVAEYLLYGPVPYPEVIAETEDLRRRAAHAGALRGVAFATALLGEAALLMGDLDRAELELTEAVDLHREIDASAGEAHSLQRLAEVRLARGDREDADRLLRRALPLARFSVLGMHLLHRIYGSMIAAAPDPVTARAVVDRAEATMGEIDHCIFCSVMLDVPSAIACADVGDLESARRHLDAAAGSAALWEGSAWQAAVLEARAHVAQAEGDPVQARELRGRAAGLFRAAGQPLDAARCEAERALADATS